MAVRLATHNLCEIFEAVCRGKAFLKSSIDSIIVLTQTVAKFPRSESVINA